MRHSRYNIEQDNTLQAMNMNNKTVANCKSNGNELSHHESDTLRLGKSYVIANSIHWSIKFETLCSKPENHTERISNKRSELKGF